MRERPVPTAVPGTPPVLCPSLASSASPAGGPAPRWPPPRHASSLTWGGSDSLWQRVCTNPRTREEGLQHPTPDSGPSTWVGGARWVGGLFTRRVTVTLPSWPGPCCAGEPLASAALSTGDSGDSWSHSDQVICHVGRAALGVSWGPVPSRAGSESVSSQAPAPHACRAGR